MIKDPLKQEGVTRRHGHIYVYLPVCTECGRVGRFVGAGALDRAYCRGPAGHSHPQAEMKLKRFKEQKK